MSAPPKKRLGEMLIEAGVIDETQLKAALGHQRRWGGKLGQSLVDMKMTTEDRIVEALARRFGYEVVNLRGLSRSPALDAALQLVPRDLATRHTFLPFATDSGTLSIAMSDPSNIAAVDELSFRTGKRVKVALAGDREVYDAIRRCYYPEEEAERTVEPISLGDAEHAPLELETTADPFGSMQAYFVQPGGPAGKQPPAAASPSWPAPASPRTAPAPFSPRPVRPVAPLAAPAGAPAAPAPAQAPAFDLGTPLDDLDDDVILDATELAPVTGERALPPVAKAPGAPVAQALPPVAQPAAPVAQAAGPGEPQLLEAVLRLARGEPVDESVLPSRRLAAGLIRLLLEKKLVTPAEVAAALAPR